MMRFEPVPEPATFDARCRRRGRDWLKKHREFKRPRDYWSAFEPDLHQAFDGLCAYSAMRIMKGQVDHFIPVSRLKGTKQAVLIYEWSNFRYGESVLNQRKADHDVLDPFQVKNDWFRILLPSLQLVMTDVMPTRWRKLAEFTLERLGLRDGEVVVRYRRQWFELYQARVLSLDGLRQCAPLIAHAVEVDLARGQDWRN